MPSNPVGPVENFKRRGGEGKGKGRGGEGSAICLA
jgi:hypothetical protein